MAEGENQKLLVAAQGNVRRWTVLLLVDFYLLSCALRGGAVAAAGVRMQKLKLRRRLNELNELNKPSVKSIKKSRRSISQLWHLNGRCQEDTIPVRRIKREEILRASSIKSFEKKKHKTTPFPLSADLGLINANGHQHAIAYVEGDKYYGAMNAWNPLIQQPNKFSLSQIWLLGVSFREDLNSIEAGWQILMGTTTQGSSLTGP